jgi:fatty acid desaturase
MDPIAHFIICHQHLLYYVFMFFGRYNLYIQSWALLLNPKERVEKRFLEIGAMAVYWTWFSLLCSYCATTCELVGFVVISHGVSGLLHIQITLSHFCMEHFTKDQAIYTTDETDWFRVQLATTMNVDCPEWLDWFHGGLQFQIEHHLFPRVPVRAHHAHPPCSLRLHVDMSGHTFLTCDGGLHFLATQSARGAEAGQSLLYEAQDPLP